jgi:uncharacterized protein YuzB (UPF0349 family)
VTHPSQKHNSSSSGGRLLKTRKPSEPGNVEEDATRPARAPNTRLIEFCLNNVDADTRRILLSHAPMVKEQPCLQRCGRCYEGPFLVVDGELREGESHQDMLEGASPEKRPRKGWQA